MSGVASFVSALAEEMAKRESPIEDLKTEDMYLTLRQFGYDGPIKVVLHCKTGVPQIVEIGDRRWKLI